MLVGDKPMALDEDKHCRFRVAKGKKKTTSKKKTPKSKSKSQKKIHKGGPRWIQELTTRDTVEEEEGTFSGNNTAEEIAIEVKRKAPTFQSAVAKIQLYLNRAGKRLSRSRRKEIKRAQSILRELYHRKDREIANKGKPKTAAMHFGWVDEEGNQHIGDQIAELIDKPIDFIVQRKPELKEGEIKEYIELVLDWYQKKYHKPKPKNEEEKQEQLTDAKKKLNQTFFEKENVPVLDYMGNKHTPVIVDRVASVHNYNENGQSQIIFSSQEDAKQYLNCLLDEDELTFASTNEALQYLSNLIKKTIKVRD